MRVLRPIRLRAVAITLPWCCFSVLHSYAEVGIIFPRNNITYRPVNPFPVVFTLHNFADIWKHQPVLEWKLIGFTTKIEYLIVDSNSIGWGPKYQLGWAGPADITIAINSTNVVRAGTYNQIQRWQLQWSLTVSVPQDTVQYCFGRNFSSTPGNLKQIASLGKIDFGINNTTGVMPDLAGRERCSRSLVTVVFNKTDIECPIKNFLPPELESCILFLDQKAADDVAQTMVMDSHCQEATWPGFLPTNCTSLKLKSVMSKVDWDPSLVLLALLVALLFG